MRPKALNFLDLHRVTGIWSRAVAHPTQVKGSKSMAPALRARDGSVAENLNLVPGIHVRAHNHRKSKALS